MYVFGTILAGWLTGTATRAGRSISPSTSAISEAIRGLTEHAELVDRRIEALREAQSETNAGVKDLVGAIRD